MTFSEQLREKTSITNEFEQDGHELINAGRNRKKTICPFHGDTDPSLMIYEDTDSFYCFGCGASGDIVGYVSLSRGIDRREAMEVLAETYGIELKNYSTPERERYKQASDLLKIFSKYYQESFARLPDDHPAKKEITRRSLPITDSYSYAPENQRNFIDSLTKKGYSIDMMKELGLVNEKNGFVYPFFSNRLLFTFKSLAGHPVGFTARALAEKDMYAKFINSISSFIFKKSDILYNESDARPYIKDNKTVYVAEGPFDVEALKKIGINNVVATCGTAFTSSHAKRLLRATDDGKIVFLFDGDIAGQKAVISVFKKLPELHAHAYAIILPLGEDPCDYLIANNTLPPEIWICDYVFGILEKRLSSLSFDQKVRMSYKAYAGFLSSIKEPAIYNRFENKIEQWAGVKNTNKFKKEQTQKAPVIESRKALEDLLAFFRINKEYQDDFIASKEFSGLDDTYKELIREYKEKSVVEDFDDEELAHRVFSLRPVEASSKIGFDSRVSYLVKQLEIEENKKEVAKLLQQVQ